MYDPDYSEEGLGFRYLVWVESVMVGAVKSFPSAVQIADLYRSKGFVDVVIDAEKKNTFDAVKEQNND